MDIEVTRLSGADRYLTGLEIAKHFAGSQDEAYQQITLAGAALAAKLKMPVFLAGQQAVKAEVEAYLKGLDPEKIYLFGGKAVLADSARDQLRP